ncbi:2509_t:CDS:2, partial [Gigaspora margarita]
TCYACQKCLSCFKEFSIYPCGCNQQTKPKAINNINEKTIRVYSRKYIPNNLLPNQKEFFKQADNCFGYNSNFTQAFSVCFCSACHSKYERIKKIKSNTTEIEKSELIQHNNNISNASCNLELKFKLFVENEDGNILPGKLIIAKLESFKEFNDFIHQWVENSRTGAMILQDNDDWNEFLKMYKSLIITDKIICVFVTMNKQDFDSRKSNEPKSKVLSISNDKNVDKDEMDKADQITKLRQKWECKICNKICYVDGDRHLELTPYRLQMWAKDIIKKNTTIDIPPVYPIFNITHGRIVRPQFPSQPTNSIDIPPYSMSYAPQSQIIYYPSSVHSASPFGLSVTHSSTPVTHSSTTIHGFFLELEAMSNESGSYTQFEEAFKNEKITLDTIKELSESDLIELGVNKMGWRKKIMKLAREY